MAQKIKEDNKDVLEIPIVCLYKTLCSLKNEQILNENPEWLKEMGPIPLWSPLKSLSSTQQPEEEDVKKDVKQNFKVVIAGRLSSLFGSAASQDKEMDTLNSLHLMNNILALCAALKNDLNEWSEKLIDKISNAALAQYTNFLKQRSITDKEVKINHLNGVFNIEGEEYKAQIHQVATGLLYTPYGYNQFNLARALYWFFNRYQFGFIKCAQRTLAIGKILNKEQDFFMYDCQSHGYPLFEGQQKNSYILKTPYLQILLYCLLKTLNFAAKINFILYNVDITIVNPLEKKVSKTGVNPAMAKKKLTNSLAAKSRASVQNKVPANRQKFTQKSVQSIRSTTSGPRRVTQNSATNSQSKILNNPAENQKIILDPNNMYYIVAVPKTGLVRAKIESKHLIVPKAGTSSEIINDSERVRKGTGKNLEVEQLLGSINLQKSASATTLTPETVEAAVIKNPENLGIKVYLVEDNNSVDLTESSSANKIKIAHQLRDFFMK